MGLGDIRGEMMIKVAEFESLDALVVRSINQYTEMIGLLGDLQKQISGNSSDSIEKFNSTFSSLQNQMQQTDQYVNERHNQSEIAGTTQHLLAKRYDLQLKMLNLLKESVVPKATSVKSLLASEMQSLKFGRRAINGYKTVSDNQGRIINRTQ